ncbi:MAG: antirestriction protein [Thiobacillaceae bacterium]
MIEASAIPTGLFVVYFPMQFEPFVYSVTSELSSDYHGAYWQFYILSNGAFYMAPEPERLYFVACENGYEGNLSADALGIAACLYAYSHRSFAGDNALAETCVQHYHWLRGYVLEHPEARYILRAID